MKKPRITEGKWIHHSNDVTDEDDDTIAVAHSMRDRADAKAISAVPEMIDALIEARNDLNLWVKEFEGCGANLIVTKKVIRSIESALTKAGCLTDKEG